jgi:hypothetical protein
LKAALTLSLAALTLALPQDPPQRGAMLTLPTLPSTEAALPAAGLRLRLCTGSSRSLTEAAGAAGSTVQLSRGCAGSREPCSSTEML